MNVGSRCKTLNHHLGIIHSTINHLFVVIWGGGCYYVSLQVAQHGCDAGGFWMLRSFLSLFQVFPCPNSGRCALLCVPFVLLAFFFARLVLLHLSSLFFMLFLNVFLLFLFLLVLLGMFQMASLVRLIWSFLFCPSFFQS